MIMRNSKKNSSVLICIISCNLLLLLLGCGKVEVEKFISSNEKLLAYKMIDINDDNIDELIMKVKREGGIVLKILEKQKGQFRQLWESNELGKEDRDFWIDQKTSKLEVTDINQDNKEEIITAAFYGPYATGLYIYVWDKGAQKPILLSPHDKYKNVLGRCFVSDFELEKGKNIIVKSNGIIRVVGKEYSLEHPPMIKIYEYRWESGRYILR